MSQVVLKKIQQPSWQVLRDFFWSLFYSVGQIAVGLLVHPYQTMQSLVKERVFVWMTLLPSIILAISTVIWKLGVVPIVNLFFTCSLNLMACDSLVFFTNWLTFFCIYWQIILLYLLIRFSQAMRIVP